MRFILINDLNVIKKEIKAIIIYFALFIFLLFCNVYFSLSYSIDISKTVLGIVFDIKTIDILYFLYHFLFILFLFFRIISNDYQIGINNLFLRISNRKYVFYKSLSLCVYLLVYYFFLFIVTIGINWYFGYSFPLLSYLPFCYFYSLFFLQIIEIIYVVFHKNIYLSILLMILFSVCIYIFKLDYHFNITLYIIGAILFMVIKNLFISSMYGLLFERGNLG